MSTFLLELVALFGLAWLPVMCKKFLPLFGHYQVNVEMNENYKKLIILKPSHKIKLSRTVHRDLVLVHEIRYKTFSK